jgi:hypothetical protein
MVIRHAEKPPDHGPPFGVTPDGEKDHESLTVRGWQRAGALACLFAPHRGPLQSNGLATPGAIFASQASPTKGSQRPPQTIMPLAERIGIMPRTLDKGKLNPLVEQARGTDGVVLICWQHEDIPSIARRILGDEDGTTAPPTWPGTRYDLVWVFDLDPESNTYRFSQVPQCLLAGDSPEPIAATGS